MLIKALVLVCASGLSPQDCTTNTAMDVIKAPDAPNEVLCELQAQAYIATLRFRPDAQNAYAKVLCKP